MKYEYTVHPLTVGFNDGKDGNYIFAKFVNNRWHPLYFGEGDLGKRAGVHHYKAKDILRRGATHIHVHVNPSRTDRLHEEADLLANYTQAYVPRRCNERAGRYPTDGASPEAGLVQGSDGNLYGTTYLGGTNNPGKGTVFRISPSGTYTSLYSFVGSPGDGANPHCGLVQGSDSNLYGTTEFGGANNVGTVFRISPSGTHTSLYSFGSIPDDGFYPLGGLAQSSDGNFYGTTYEGGTNGNGTIFRISTSGTYTSLYTFVGFPGDGIFPEAGLVQGSDGYFYGTTSQGGAYTYGNVSRFSVPLNPPPNQISRIQKSATNIVLFIPSVAGETYQLQFSSSMKPTDWVNVAGLSVTNSIGALLTLTNFGGAVGLQGFYRFDITP